MMDFLEFCSQTQIAHTPELEALYLQAENSGELLRPPLTQWIKPLFPQLHQIVLDASQQIAGDGVALRYLNLLRLTYRQPIPTPFLEPAQGNVMRNFAPTLALISFWPDTEVTLQQRGFDKATCTLLSGKFESYLLRHQSTFGYLATSRTLFFWAKHYLTPDIFCIGNLEFEITGMPADQNIFRHIRSGELVALGNVCETEDAFCGNGIRYRSEEIQRHTLPKAEYQRWISAGEDILSVHIPRGADISAAACADTYQKALDFFARYYPERTIRGFHCQSWLMDPALEEFLPKSSRIVSFQQFFQRYPVRSNGKEVFSFVHPTPFASYAELPENTALERALKQRYLNNDPIFVHAGLHLLTC